MRLALLFVAVLALVLFLARSDSDGVLHAAPVGADDGRRDAVAADLTSRGSGPAQVATQRTEIEAETKPDEIVLSVPLTVATRIPQRRSTAAAPDRRVRLGVGWKDPGATAHAGEVPDVSTCLHRVPLMEAVTDGEGKLALDLPIPAAYADAEFVWAEFFEDGHQRRVDHEPIPTDAEKPAALSVHARLGFTLRVRVLRGDVPVASAWAGAFEQTKNGPASRYNGTGSAGVRGVAGIHVEMPSLERIEELRESYLVLLHARHAGLGAGQLADVLALDHDPDELIDVEISGAGVIAGTLTDPAGIPIEGYTLVAFPEGDHLRKRPSSVNSLPRCEGEGGLYEGSAVTGEGGSFRFEGLQQGSYVLKLRASGAFDYGLTAGFGAVETSTEGLNVEAALHRVRVILDGAGEGAKISELRDTEDTSRDLLAGKTLLYVSASNGEGLALAAYDKRVMGPRVPREDGIEFALVPGSPYLFGAMDQYHAPCERELFLGESTWFHEVRVPWGPSLDPGEVGVRIHADGARPATKVRPAVTVRSLHGRRELYRTTAYVDVDKELPVRLPAGEYHAEVGETYAYSREFRPVEEQLTIPAGGRRSWDVNLAPTGQVEVLLTLAPAPSEALDPNEAAGVAHPFGARTVRARQEDQRTAMGGARVVGFRDGKRYSLFFARQARGVGRDASSADTWILPGRVGMTTMRHQVGELTVVAEIEGYRGDQVTIEVEAGEIHRVELRLVAQ